MALSPDEIAKILAEDARTKTGRGGKRGPRIDPTEPREVNVWFKQSHHLCAPDCPHRVDPKNHTAELRAPTPEELKDGPHYRTVTIGRACWNPDCKDPRPDPEGIRAVAMVHEKYICRYCFLAGYNRKGEQSG